LSASAELLVTGSTANSITIKLQRFHGFTPAAIKNTAKSIFPDDVQFIWNMLFAVFLIAAGANP